MIFIDSVFPFYLTDAGNLPEKPVVKPAEELAAMKLREKVELNMTHARMMGRAWSVPPWKGVAVPPAVLLRATDELPGANKIFASTGRSSRSLGWEKFEEEYGQKFVEQIVDVEGNHFSIFEFDRVSRCWATPFTESLLTLIADFCHICQNSSGSRLLR